MKRELFKIYKKQTYKLEVQKNELETFLNMNLEVALERRFKLSETTEVSRRYTVRPPSKLNSCYLHLLLATICLISCASPFNSSRLIL